LASKGITIATLLTGKPSMMIPLLASQDLTPMLSQHDWQETFDGGFLCQPIKI